MNIIREPDGNTIGMMPLFCQWGIRRCNQKGCTEKPTTIIATQGDDMPVFGLCEAHFQQGNVPGGTKFDLVFDNFDAFKFDDELREVINATPEEIDQYLREAGYDPDALVTRMRQRMKVAMDASPLNPKNEKDTTP